MGRRNPLSLKRLVAENAAGTVMGVWSRLPAYAARVRWGSLRMDHADTPSWIAGQPVLLPIQLGVFLERRIEENNEIRDCDS